MFHSIMNCTEGKCGFHFTFSLNKKSFKKFDNEASPSFCHLTALIPFNLLPLLGKKLLFIRSRDSFSGKIQNLLH